MTSLCNHYIICVLDFAKAFDRVGHRRLIEKLRCYGVDGDTNRWIQGCIARLFGTWKTGPAMTASQHSGHFYWINPWLHTPSELTALATNTGWLHQNAFPPIEHGLLCFTIHPEALPHLENWSRHDCQSAFWPFLLDKSKTTSVVVLGLGLEGQVLVNNTDDYTLSEPTVLLCNK